MMDRRQKLIEVFQDTQEFYSENAELVSAIKYGQEHTRLYEADAYPVLPAIKKMGEVQVIQSRTFEAAMSLHKDSPDKKIAVLNFASAMHPGGGVKNGSSAQEESLCRCSTLYPALTQNWLREKFYNVNRAAHDCRHTDACIYSPNVVICKTDEDIPRRMKPENFVTVDVLTCAAPNLRNEPANWHNPETGEPIRMDPQELLSLHIHRGRHIMCIAAAHSVDILILGAFGCGAFRNDPYIVAQAYRTVTQEYQKYFDTIVFAIYCRDYESENFRVFRQELSQLDRRNQKELHR